MDIDTYDFENAEPEDLAKFGPVRDAAAILSINARDRDTDPRPELISAESIKVRAVHNIVHPTAPFIDYMLKVKDQIRAHNAQFSAPTEYNDMPIPVPNHLNLDRPLGLNEGGLGDVLTMSFQPTTNVDEVRVAKTSIMKGAITALRSIIQPGMSVLVFGAGDGYADVNRVFKSVGSFDLKVDLYEPAAKKVDSYSNARYVSYGDSVGYVAGDDIFSRDKFMDIPKNQYHVVVAINSIHFALASDEEAVRQIRYVLKDNGKLVCLYPDRIGIQTVDLAPPGRHKENITMLGLSSPPNNVPHHTIKIFSHVLTEPSYTPRTIEMALATCGFDALAMHNSACKNYFRETNFMQRMRDTYDKRAFNVVIATPDLSHDSYEDVEASFGFKASCGATLPFGVGVHEFDKKDDPSCFGITLSKGKPMGKKDIPYLGVEDWLISPKIDGVPSYAWFQDGKLCTNYGSVLLSNREYKAKWRKCSMFLLQVELVFNGPKVDIFLVSVLSFDRQTVCSIGHGLAFGIRHLPEFIHIKGWDTKHNRLVPMNKVFGCPVDGWVFDSYSSMSQVVPIPQSYANKKVDVNMACAPRSVGYSRYVKYEYTVDLEVGQRSFVLVPQILQDFGIVFDGSGLSPGIHEFSYLDGRHRRPRPDRLGPNTDEQIQAIINAVDGDVVERQLQVNSCREILPAFGGVSAYLTDPLDRMKFQHKIALAASYPRPLQLRTRLGPAPMRDILEFRRSVYDAVRRGAYTKDLSKLYADLTSGKLVLDDVPDANIGQFVKCGLPGAPNYATIPVRIERVDAPVPTLPHGRPTLPLQPP